MKIWKTAELDEERARSLAAELNLPSAVAHLLVARGLAEPRAADHFLNPRLSDLTDPFLLPDMEKAVVRTWKAIDENEPIVVFGDYDADGVTSTALMIHVLKKLGAHVTPFLPNRVEDGYGLSLDTFRRCYEAYKPKLMITVDCGTGSVEAVEAARAQQLDVVVTDHHEPAGPRAPALALVNPRLGDVEAARDMAGVGVAFKLCHALLKKGRDMGREKAKSVDLRRFLDLVGIGTITDVVPLVNENRIFARHGLTRINKTESIGLKSLIEVSGIRGPLESWHISFLIGPRLNAAGRIGDAQAALELLLTEDLIRARQLAVQLDAANRERQDTEAQIVEEAIGEIDSFFKPDRHFGLVVARKDWHPGVIGIVASRLCARYYRPAVVISTDESGEGRGSCRSIEGFNLIKALEDCADLLDRFGGHTMAAGLDIQEARIESFKTRFNEVAKQALAGQDLRPSLEISAWMELSEADQKLADSLESMRPFGLGNSTPVFAVRGVRLVGPPRRVGDGRHLKMSVASGSTRRDAIAFGMGEREIPDGPIDIAFQLQINTYQGLERLQLNLQDFRPSE